MIFLPTKPCLSWTAQLFGVTIWLVVGAGCAEPYSPRSYRQEDADVSYAMICHDGRRTMRVPEEEWRAHKAHGDYRGPCRATGIVEGRERKSADHTTTHYKGRQARAEQSEEEWAQIVINRAEVRAADSLATVRETGPTTPDR